MLMILAVKTFGNTIGDRVLGEPEDPAR